MSQLLNKKFKRVLSIETSCDDTSVAVVRSDGFVEGLISANQDSFHEPFGGIVPEIAGRNHTLHLLPLIDQLLSDTKISFDDIQGLVVTNRPGLVGSLLVGISTVKTLAQILELPFIGVNHLEGHLQAGFLSDEKHAAVKIEYPYVALAVSGGHSTIYLMHDFGRYEVLGATLDDAAGEAFDKFAKMLGLGFPGGIRVDQHAKNGDAKKYDFPRSMIKENNADMSFSGLKSSAARMLQSMTADEILQNREDLCASFQAAVVDVLVEKLNWAIQKTNCRRAIVTGGVSANSLLRQRCEAWSVKNNIQLVVPPLRYCTDNAAMIGFAGIQRLNKGEFGDLTMGPSPSSLSIDFIGQNR